MNLRKHLKNRLTGRPDDAGFALIFAMAFVLLIGTFSLILLSQMTSEVRQTQFAQKHEQTLNSATAGLNAGLNVVRNATDSVTGIGVTAYLPCTVGSNHASLSGSVNSSGTQTWTTDIYYLTTDPNNPTSMTTAQASAAALSCPLTVVPSYAYIVAAGHQASIYGSSASFGDRTIHATYSFTTSNASSVGGQIVYSGRCWDVGSTPAIGTQVSYQTCLTAGSPSQNWYYRPDASLLWHGDPSKNLCLDYRSTAPIRYMTLQTCIGNGSSGGAYDSANNNYYYAGQMTQEYSSNYNGYTWNDVITGGDRGTGCVNSYRTSSGTYGAGAVGDVLVMTTSHCTGGAVNSVPGAAVGAGGAAGVYTGMPGPTQQLVNLNYFSRCLDVFSSDPSQGLIHYPCHQAPDPDNIEGNEQFQYSGTNLATGTIQTVRTDATPTTGNYSTVCFESSGSTVKLNPCVGGMAAQQWLMSGSVPGRYVDSYLIKDYNGKCVTAGSGYFGSIKLNTCNGANNQKWNAPPGGAQSELTAVGEQ